MFGKKKLEAGITLIANNCELSGDIHFSDQLLVNGTVNGNIFAEAGSKALITVSEKGRVSGDIRVPNVVINGRVAGDIYADKHVELSAKAEIVGNVYYSLIEMVMGSRVDGSLVHVKPGENVESSGLPPKAGSARADFKELDAASAERADPKTAVKASSKMAGFQSNSS
jgi:cytoskeletal protein CcmA (bactofilin family)